MLKKLSCNMKPFDALMRFILATIITFISLYEQDYYLLIVGAIIYYTAYTKFCFVYYLFKINERFSIKNYYLSFLPKHNPSAAIMFSANGKIVFKNRATDAMFDFIGSATDLNIQNTKEMIANNLSHTVIHKHNQNRYKIELIGLSQEKILLAYFTDVTEIFELNDAIEDTQREVIYAMGEIGETRSKETGNHVKRVAIYSEILARLHGLSEEEASLLKMASPMHDIGKVGIPDAILNAPRKLTKEEFEIMKTHATLGYDMLKSSNKPILQAAAIVAHEHHEKYDGSGYPNATRGEEIHIYGRITAIADVFDALGSERVYKKAWELEKILELFRQEGGRHFDPHLVELFLDNLDQFLQIRDQFKDA